MKIPAFYYEKNYGVFDFITITWSFQLGAGIRGLTPAALTF